MTTSRVRGCLLGGAIGDALGAPVEFLSLAEILHRFGEGGVRDFVEVAYGADRGVGLVTDDTQMTLFTLEGVINALIRRERGLGFTTAVLHHSYLKWFHTQTSTTLPEPEEGWLVRQRWLYSRRAPGNTCLQALGSWRRTEDTGWGTPARNDSKGCGGVMRSAPIGFLALLEDAHGLPTVFDIATEAASYTHGHPTGQIASGALALLIGHLMLGADLETAAAETLRYVRHVPRGQETARALMLAMENIDLEHRPNRAHLETLGGGWVAEEALAIALHCALTYPEPHRMLDALAMAATHSGDSDSTAAICGNILGTLHGDAALPKHLAFRVEGRATILEMADDVMYELADKGPGGAGDMLVLHPGAETWERMGDGSGASPGVHIDAWYERYPAY